jgi:YbbR domain-containing protein
VEARNPKKSRIGLKVISIVLAVLLWIYIGNQGGTSTRQDTVVTELQYLNLGEGLSIEKAPKTINVTLWGAYSERGTISAYVDLAGLKPGTHRLPVKLEAVRGAMFTRANPKEVEVVLTRLQERELRVDYQITTNPPPGYELLDLAITPDKCIISGEVSILSQVNRIVCPVNLGNVRGVQSYRLRLQARDANGNEIRDGLRIIPDTVLVHAVVSPKTFSKSLDVKPILKGNVAEGYRVREVIVEPVQVGVISQQKIPDEQKQINTAEIDISGRKQSFSQEVAVQAAENVKVYPSRVLVEVSIEKIPEGEGD